MNTSSSISSNKLETMPIDLTAAGMAKEPFEPLRGSERSSCMSPS